MRWIVVTLVLAVLCLAGVWILRARLDRQEQTERVAPPDDTTSKDRKLVNADPPFPQTPARNYEADITQAVGSLNDADNSTRAASMDLLASLPGDAFPAIATASKNQQLPQASQNILRDLLPLYKARAARQKVLREQRLACLREALAAYEKYGHKYFRWDARVRAGLTAFFQADPPFERTAAQDAWLIKSMGALFSEDDCDDPIAYFVYGLTLDEIQPDPLHHHDAAFQAFGKAVELAARNHWPAEWQALFKARWLVSDDRTPVDADHPIKGRSGLDEIAGFPASPWPASIDKADWAMQLVRQQNIDRRLAFYERFHASMEKSTPGGIEPLVFTGEFYARYGWDARGSGFADSVTPEGFKLFQQRLQLAREAFEKAYALHPDDPRAGTGMIRVCMGQEVDPSVTQQWFDRAIAADPDDNEAVIRMMMNLEPKWHGSPETLAAFAERLRATHNYRGKMPLAIVKYHQAMASYQPSATAYLSRPEVWEQIHSAYESYLLLFPRDRNERTAYTGACTRAAKWQQANAEFQILGDQPWPGIFTNDQYLNYRSIAKGEAGGKE